MRNVNGTIIFEHQPRISAFASVAGKKEAEGPLRDYFDKIVYDSYFGQATFEQAETEMMRIAVEAALEKGGMMREEIDLAFCGDLLNQCVASSFAMSGFGIPYMGIYGACSTMALGLIMSAIAIEGGAAVRAACAASSHYCTAERQYRMPLEYGSQRPPTAQWTVTGAGACVVEADSAYHRRHKTSKAGTVQGDAAKAKSNKDDTINQNESSGQASKDEAVDGKPAVDISSLDVEHTILPNAHMPYISAACPGIITDYAVTDQNNMGAAMAPAAADTIFRFLEASGTSAEDYDMIFTGDLGRVGSRLLYDLMEERGIDLALKHQDCGVMIFDEAQDIHAGGSGCGCCASVLCGHILRGMLRRQYRNILFIATGALLSPTTVLQKQTIPSVAHLVNIRI